MTSKTCRRNQLVIGLGALCAAAAAVTTSAGGPPSAGPSGNSEPRANMADHALRLLQEGNERFVAGKCIHPNTDVFRIADTGGNGQHPFAAIITCADSRVAVERLFDRGVGDLFVVRVAGNICDPNECGSVEYACEHLGAKLVVVMGHSKCGAVKAAIGGGDAGPNINSLLDNITPAVQAVKAAHPDLGADDMVDACVRENVWRSISDMYTGSQAMREMVSKGAVRIVGAAYDVETGRVEWMGSHPMQSALLRSGENSGPQATDSTGSSPNTNEKPAPGAEKPRNDKSPADKTGFVKPGSGTVPTPGATPTKKPEAEKPAPSSHPH